MGSLVKESLCILAGCAAELEIEIIYFACQSFLLIQDPSFILILDQFTLKMKMSEQTEKLLIH